MKITFVLANTWATQCSIIHENEYRPYRKRTVSVELTPEQEQQISVQVVGHNGPDAVREEILECFIENSAT